MKFSLPYDFAPRPYQKRYMGYFDHGGKRAACVWHRRAGKDLTALNQTCKMAFERVGMYWHTLPTYRQAKKALWDGFTKDGKKTIDSIFPPQIVRRKNDGELLVELTNGSIVQLVGADTVDNLVGAGPVGVTFSEFSLTRPAAWDLIRPMLTENNGWASFIFTPRGNNHAKALFDVASKTKGWYAEKLTVYDTGLTYPSALDPYVTLSPDEMMEEARAAGMPDPLVRQEYLCDFTAALVGSVWGDLMEVLEKRGALEHFVHEVDGVFTSWDLGISDSTAIWFWRIKDGGIDVVDHYEAHGQPIAHFFDVMDGRETELTEKVSRELLYRMRGYKYAIRWVPHDARARTLQTGASILDQFIERYGTDGVSITPQLSLLDGIQAARWLLQRNVRFHPRTAKGIEALKQYHYEYDEDAKVFGTKPEHDWSSHSADAFRYVACAVRNSELIMKRVEDSERRVAPKVRATYEFTLDELHEWREEDLASMRERIG